MQPTQGIPQAHQAGFANQPQTVNQPRERGRIDIDDGNAYCRAYICAPEDMRAGLRNLGRLGGIAAVCLDLSMIRSKHAWQMPKVPEGIHLAYIYRVGATLVLSCRAAMFLAQHHRDNPNFTADLRRNTGAIALSAIIIFANTMVAKLTGQRAGFIRLATNLAIGPFADKISDTIATQIEAVFFNIPNQQDARAATPQPEAPRANPAPNQPAPPPAANNAEANRPQAANNAPQAEANAPEADRNPRNHYATQRPGYVTVGLPASIQNWRPRAGTENQHCFDYTQALFAGDTNPECALIYYNPQDQNIYCYKHSQAGVLMAVKNRLAEHFALNNENSVLYARAVAAERTYPADDAADPRAPEANAGARNERARPAAENRAPVRLDSPEMRDFWDEQIFTQLNDFAERVRAERVPDTHELEVDFVNNNIRITNTRTGESENFPLINIPDHIEQKFFIAEKIRAFIKVNHLDKKNIHGQDNYIITPVFINPGYDRYESKIKTKYQELFGMTGYGLNERIINSIRVMPNNTEIQYNFTINNGSSIPNDATVSVRFDSKNDLVNTLIYTMGKAPEKLYYCADKWDAPSRKIFRHHYLDFNRVNFYQREAFGMAQLRADMHYKAVAQIPWIKIETRLQEKMTAKILTNRYYYDRNIVTTDAHGRKQINQEALFQFLTDNRRAVALVKGNSALARNGQPVILTITLRNRRDHENQPNALIRTRARHIVNAQEIIQHRHPLLTVSTRADLAQLVDAVMTNKKGEPYIMVIVE